MSTEQNYVGRGNYATPLEPSATQNPSAAISGPQPLSQTDNRSTNLEHHQVLHELYVAAGSFSDIPNGVSDGVRALTTVLGHWVKTKYKRLVREGESDEDLVYHETVITGVLDAIEFIVKVSEAHEDADSYRLNMIAARKEVSHE